MVAPGAEFRGGTLIGQKIGGLRCKTSWFSVRKYVMTKKKKKGLRLPISGFSVSKEKKQNKWCHPKMVTHGASSPPSDATDSNSSCCLFEAGISSSKPSN